METRFNMFDNEIGAAFTKRFANISMVIARSPLPMSAGETAVRLSLVGAWRESAVFTEAEQAALALAEEGTRLADACQGVSDETWAQVRKHYDDDQVAALVCLVAMINAANRLGVILRQKGGSYEPGMTS